MTTIIDELVMRFGLDGSQFDAGAKKAKGSLKTLKDDAGKTAKSMEDEGKRAARFFTEMQRAAMQFFAVLAGSTGLTQMITQVIQLEAHLGRLADRTGQATESLQAFGNVAELLGGKADEMQSSMSALSQAMVNMKYKGEMSPMLLFFSQVGVSVGTANGQMRDQEAILLDLASASERMSKQDFFNLAQSSGISPSMIEVVMKGRRELEKYLREQRKNALVTKEQSDKARHLTQRFGELKQSAQSMAIEFVSSVTPAIEKFFGWMQSGFTWMQQNSELIKGVFIGIGTVMALYFIPPIIAATLAAAPLIIAIGGLIAVIALLWEDYQTWKNGGKSLIDWGKWEPEIRSAVNAISGLIDKIKELFGIAKDKSIFINAIRSIAGEIGAIFSELINAVGNVATAISYAMDGEWKKAALTLVSSQSRESIARGDPVDASKLSVTFGVAGAFQRIGNAIIDPWKDGNGLNTDGYRNPNAPNSSYAPAGGGHSTQPASPQAAARLASLEQKYNLPAGLLDSVWAQESARGKNMGPSSAGALGHFQFMPPTARQYGLKNPNDFNESSEAAARMYSDLLKMYGGNVDKALAAYNWGSGNVQRKGMENAPLETRNYIRQIKGRMGQGVQPQQYMADNRAQAAIAQANQAVQMVSNIENNIGTVVVQTQATDAAGIAQQIPMALQRSLSGATYQFDMGQN